MGLGLPMWKPWAWVKPISAQTRASAAVSMPSATVLTSSSRASVTQRLQVEPALGVRRLIEARDEAVVELEVVRRRPRRAPSRRAWPAPKSS